jgi:Ni,Fe-hydrogenase III small subunit
LVDISRALITVGWDLGSFGIQFVALPCPAVEMLVTGEVSNNILFSLQKTYDEVASPKLVIVVIISAILEGMFCGHSEVKNSDDTYIKADLYIPGCPPHTLTILGGLLRLLQRI